MISRLLKVWPSSEHHQLNAKALLCMLMRARTTGAGITANGIYRGEDLCEESWHSSRLYGCAWSEGRASDHALEHEADIAKVKVCWAMQI